MFPSDLIQSTRPFLEAFLETCIKQGRIADDAKCLWDMLPENIRACSCIVPKIGPYEVYEFGDPFTRMPGGVQPFGSPQMAHVEWLTRAVYAANRFLTAEQRSQWLKQLGNSGKHRAFLDEMCPVVAAKESVTCTYEVAGLGAYGKSIDWKIEIPSSTMVLMDAKYRLAGLVNHMCGIIPGIIKGEVHIPSPPLKVEHLFKSIECKFLVADPAKQLQGCWVTLDMKYDDMDLEKAFQELDPQKVHFAVMGDWYGVKVVQKRSGIDLSFILEALSLKQI